MKKLLVVVDMQKDFVDGALGTEEAVKIVDGVAKKISEWDGDIAVTLDTHYDNYPDTREGKYLPVPHCIKGTPGWELVPEVKAALARTASPVFTFEKGSFGSPALVRLAGDDKGAVYGSVLLIGLCTDICVVSNALMIKNTYPELDVTVEADLCAGVTPESHEAALRTMKMCQIDVTG